MNNNRKRLMAASAMVLVIVAVVEAGDFEWCPGTLDKNWSTDTNWDDETLGEGGTAPSDYECGDNSDQPPTGAATVWMFGAGKLVVDDDNHNIDNLGVFSGENVIDMENNLCVEGRIHIRLGDGDQNSTDLKIEGPSQGPGTLIEAIELWHEGGGVIEILDANTTLSVVSTTSCTS